MYFVFDLDGTLVFGDNQMDVRIQEALKRLEKEGYELVFASARAYRDCYPLLAPEFSDRTIIGLNGSQIMKNGKLQAFFPLDDQVSQKLFDYCLQHKLPIFADSPYDYAYQEGQAISFLDFVYQGMGQRLELKELTNVLKCVVFTRGDDTVVTVLQSFLDQWPSIGYFYHEEEEAFYITARKINKAQALRQVTSSPYICFGNDKNDLQLFEEATYAVQIGSYEALLSLADEVIDTADNLIDKICKSIDHLSHIYKRA